MCPRTFLCGRETEPARPQQHQEMKATYTSDCHPSHRAAPIQPPAETLAFLRAGEESGPALTAASARLESACGAALLGAGGVL